MQNSITFARPDDFHQHLREGKIMQMPLAHASAQFGRIMVMPNLRDPLCTSKALGNYLAEVDRNKPQASRLEVFGTLYLSPSIGVEELERAKNEQPLLAVKWYPRGVTTNSDKGIAQIEQCDKLFSAMQEMDIVLSIHGEVHDEGVDIFDREEVFIHKMLLPLLRRFPRLRMVLEHISTRAAVECLYQHGSERFAATITAHHLLVNRHHMLAGGIKPHLYCLPIVKREQDRRALLEAATSGRRCFFLGSDSAPHAQGDKESACGCAGCYTAAHAMELYAEAFDSVEAIDRLPDFSSSFGASFYGLPVAKGTITLERSPHRIPERYQNIVPFWANRELSWRVSNFA